MSKECTTHHFACDCREEKFKQLEQENAELRTYKANTTIRIAAIEKENAMWVQTVTRLLKEAQSARTAFDAALKEAQP
jgi:hypothetical protein